MPHRTFSRWLKLDEQQAIIHFISCNPGRTGREIGQFLGLPKKSVNGFLYRHGLSEGVMVDEYRWYPVGLFEKPEPCPRVANPPPAPKPEWTDKPEVITTTVVKTEPANLAQVNKQSGWSRMGYLYAALFVVALLLIKAARSAELVQVRSCYDGDTCTLNTGEKVRLACIDTPELRGKRADPVPATIARDYLRSLVVNKPVTLNRITKDRYGRTVGELYVGRLNVQQELVRTGHAEIYRRYAHQCNWSRNTQP